MENSMPQYEIQYPGDYQPTDVTDDNIDVRIHFSNGDVFWGTLFTLENVKRLLSNGECDFFWATNMVIVKRLDRESIEKVINELVASGTVYDAFCKIENGQTMSS